MINYYFYDNLLRSATVNSQDVSLKLPLCGNSEGVRTSSVNNTVRRTLLSCEQLLSFLDLKIVINTHPNASM